MSARVLAAAYGIRSKCLVDPNCDSYAWPSTWVYQGITFQLLNGWPEAGNSPGMGAGGIDSAISSPSFTPTGPDHMTTRFELAGAPTPSQCAVDYLQPGAPGWILPPHDDSPPTTRIISTGC